MSSERRDEGQMMLLAAIVLLVAFLSLTTLVARIGTIEQETQRDVSPVILGEATVVARAVQALNATTTSSVTAANMSLLQGYEAQRGFLLTWSCGANPMTLYLSDGQSQASLPAYDALGKPVASPC